MYRYFDGTTASIVRVDETFVFVSRLAIRMALIRIGVILFTFLKWSELELLVKRHSENYRYCVLSVFFSFCPNVNFSVIFNCQFWFNDVNCAVHSSCALSAAGAGNSKIR